MVSTPFLFENVHSHRLPMPTKFSPHSNHSTPPLLSTTTTPLLLHDIVPPHDDHSRATCLLKQFPLGNVFEDLLKQFLTGSIGVAGVILSGSIGTGVFVSIGSVGVDVFVSPA